MRRLIAMKISARLFFAFLVVALVAICGSGILSYAISREAILNRLENQLLSISNLKEEQLNQLMEDKKSHVLELASSEQVVDYFSKFLSHDADFVENSAWKDAEELAKMKLSGWLAGRIRYSELLEVSMLDLEGVIVSSTDPAKIGMIRNKEQFFNKGMSGPYIQKFYYAGFHDKPILTISAPILDYDGVLVGVAAGNINLTVISDLMSEVGGLGDSGETFLVNELHFMVTESRFLEGQVMKKALYTKDVNECLESAGEGYFQESDYRNVEVVGYYRWIPDQEVCMISKIDMRELEEPMQNLRAILFSFSIALFAAILIISIFFTKRITLPLKSLAKAVNSVRDGNLDVSISLKTYDELEDLSNVFNKMIIDLKRQKHDLENHSRKLEKSVSDRTAELNEKVLELENSKIAILNILEDVTASKEALEKAQLDLVKKNRDVEKANMELQRVDKDKNEFISITAHELKTPLASIIGFTRLLQDRKVASDTRQRDNYLTIIREDSIRLKKLIDDILDLSRLDLGTLKFFYEKADLRDLIQLITKELSILASQKGIVLRFRVAEDVPFYLVVDKSRLGQVLINLINNAIKFTPDKKGKAVTVDVAKKGSVLLFSVKDQGIGIASGQIKKLFRRFYQIDSSYTRSVGGSGLGLSISKGIIEFMGGKIWIRSAVGKGTTFFFTVPMGLKESDPRSNEQNINTPASKAIVSSGKKRVS